MTRRELFAAGLGAAFAAVALVCLQQFVLGDSRRQPLVSRPGASGSAAGAVEPPDQDDQAWRTANANLADVVRRTQQRLEENEAQRKALERELKQARVKLAASEGDGAPMRNEFDLTQEDWKELAKTGTVKARFPCRLDPDWHVGPEQATALGLTPADVAAVETAYTNEEDRIASVIQPGCARVLGNAELARRLGTQVCTAVVTESAKDDHTDLQLVADIRAGNVPMPAADQLDPFAAMVLAQSGSMQALQADLAAALGPEEAHRIAFADELGSCSGTWGGEPPKH